MRIRDKYQGFLTLIEEYKDIINGCFALLFCSGGIFFIFFFPIKWLLELFKVDFDEDAVLLFSFFISCIIFFLLNSDIKSFSEKIFVFLDERLNTQKIKKYYNNYFKESEKYSNYSKKLSIIIFQCEEQIQLVNSKKYKGTFTPPHQGIAPVSLLNEIGKKFEETNGSKAEAYKVLTQSHWYKKLDTAEQNKLTENEIIDFLYEQSQKHKENKTEKEKWDNKENLINTNS